MMKWLAGSGQSGIENDFAGKIIAVYSRWDQGGLLKDVRIARLDGRSFLVGRYAPRETRDWSDVTCWLAIDEVVKLLVFDSLDAAKWAFEQGENLRAAEGATGAVT